MDSLAMAHFYDVLYKQGGKLKKTFPRDKQTMEIVHLINMVFKNAIPTNPIFLVVD